MIYRSRRQLLRHGERAYRILTLIERDVACGLGGNVSATSGKCDGEEEGQSETKAARP